MRVLKTLAIENYRSLRRLVLDLGRLTVVTGANGSGKSSLYRALRLLADTARNGAVAALARQGGLQSVLWAGPETLSRGMRDGSRPVQGTVRRGPVELRLGFAGADLGYCVDFGLPVDFGPRRPGSSLFALDPQIKRECAWSGPVLRPAALLCDRANGAVRLRSDDGSWVRLAHPLTSFDSMLSEVADAEQAPELLLLRQRLRSWRFYDHVRTDGAAPARQAHVGTHTPVLAADGGDLAAALQTIAESGAAADLAQAVDRAFAGSRIEVREHEGRFDLVLHQHGLLRPLSTAELSDGTLRYLLWVAALLTPDPPPLLVLNEPETSLHPELLPALADLIRGAARGSQVVVVTHSAALVGDLAGPAPAGEPATVVELVKDVGQTTVGGRRSIGQPLWSWPAR